MQTILITGGSGLIGSRLGKQLTDKGYKVIVLTRNKQQIAGNGQIEFAEWDINKQAIDVEAVQKADYIIHLAGAGVMDKRWSDDYKRIILESRTKSSELLVKTLKENSTKVKAVI